jgi:hypothetical protein
MTSKLRFKLVLPSQAPYGIFFNLFHIHLLEYSFFCECCIKRWRAIYVHPFHDSLWIILQIGGHDLLYYFDQLFGHRSQGPSKRRVHWFVTGHIGDRLDRQKFPAPAALSILLIGKFLRTWPKRCQICHSSSRSPKRSSSLCGGHRSQGPKSRSK